MTACLDSFDHALARESPPTLQVVGQILQFALEVLLADEAHAVDNMGDAMLLKEFPAPMKVCEGSQSWIRNMCMVPEAQAGRAGASPQAVA